MSTRLCGVLSVKLSSSNYHYVFIIMILAISAFTHLWNASGFPDIFFDEGAYMHRAMHVLKGLGPEEGALYDHPFFGQIFLASIFTSIGYPHSLNLSDSANSVSTLYLIPRIIMGILAIIDTLLIYKIADKRYGKNVALISAVLFSVMPITWITRRILLDSILLPFLLLSILAALQAKNSKHSTLLILLSGTCLGLAIFTKIPAFTAMPLIGSLVSSLFNGLMSSNFPKPYDVLKTHGDWLGWAIGIAGGIIGSLGFIKQKRDSKRLDTRENTLIIDALRKYNHYIQLSKDELIRLQKIVSDDIKKGGDGIIVISSELQNQTDNHSELISSLEKETVFVRPLLEHRLHDSLNNGIAAFLIVTASDVLTRFPDPELWISKVEESIEMIDHVVERVVAELKRRLPPNQLL